MISDRCDWDMQSISIAAVVTINVYDEKPHRRRVYLRKISPKELHKPQKEDIYLLIKCNVCVGIDQEHWHHWVITDGEKIYGVDMHMPKAETIVGQNSGSDRPIFKDYDENTSRKNLALCEVSNFTTGPYISHFIYANIVRRVRRFLDKKLGKYL